MAIIFKGFEDEQMMLRISKIILNEKADISKYLRNIADIEIKGGDITLTKKGEGNK